MAGTKGVRTEAPLEPALKRRLTLGLGVVILLCATVIGWAANATLTGAVIAPGLVVIDTSVKKVQHQAGGIVGAAVAASMQGTILFGTDRQAVARPRVKLSALRGERR